jgi:hypothetical protein
LAGTTSPYSTPVVCVHDETWKQTADTVPVSQELWPASQIPVPAFQLQPAAYSLVTTVGSILQLPRDSGDAENFRCSRHRTTGGRREFLASCRFNLAFCADLVHAFVVLPPPGNDAILGAVCFPPQLATDKVRLPHLQGSRLVPE